MMAENQGKEPKNRFLPGAILRLINNKMVLGGSATAVRAVLSEAGLSEEEITQQLRFSLVYNIGAVGEELSEMLSAKESYAPQSGWSSFVERLKAIEENPGRGLYRYKEEVEFAVILSIHANAKDYGGSYKNSITRRMRAYYSQQNYNFADLNKPYLRDIFNEGTISKYHDYIPRNIRGGLFRAIVRGQDERWRNYLLALMEWNSMSLIRETYRFIVHEAPRAFLLKGRYIPEVKIFMSWWNTNHGDEENFRYSWYLKPNILKEVSHAKLHNLYSAVLRICKDQGLMAHYKDGCLTPMAIPLEDVQVTESLHNVTDNVDVDQAYLDLIQKQYSAGVAQSDLISMLMRLLQGGQIPNRNVTDNVDVDQAYLGLIKKQYSAGVAQADLNSMLMRLLQGGQIPNGNNGGQN